MLYAFYTPLFCKSCESVTTENLVSLHFYQGLPAKRPRPVTQPESPVIRKRFRPNNTDGGYKESHVIKANPMPNFEKSFVPQYSHRLVIPEPFSFEERDKIKRCQHIERIEVRNLHVSFVNKN